MQLHLSTWQEIDEYLTTSKAIIIPVGSTEQHGPNGLIGTDAICPEVVAEKVGVQTGALVGPTLNVGVAQHHLGFSGSMSLRPSTMIAVVEDWVGSLSVHGFEKFYFLNGHGGNIATLSAAFSELHAARSFEGRGSNRPALTCRLRNWWQGGRVMAYSKKHFGAAEGGHATPSEVSLTYAAYPDSVKNVPLSPEIAPRGGFSDAEDYRKRFPDGRIGSNPGLATIAHGEALLEAAVTDVVEDWQNFVA